jgi:hypothetical protein
VSSVWGQCTSDWNSAGPHAGMQSTLLRSHVRELALGVERELDHAIDLWSSTGAGNEVNTLLRNAIRSHRQMTRHYDDWQYKQALYACLEALSWVDQALTLIGEPDRIHDPISELGLTPFD